MEPERPANQLRVVLRIALAIVVGAALTVDFWILDRTGAQQADVVTVAVGAVGVGWARRPSATVAFALVASALSLAETVTGSHEGLRFALFTEFVVLPVLFGAVLVGPLRRRWPMAALVGIAAEAIALRADERAIRSILAISMLVLLGAAMTAVVYIRLRDTERGISIERARQSERIELARELHDIVGHHVTGIVVLAQASRFTSGDGPGSPSDRAFADIEAAGLETLTSVRRLIGLLRTEPTTSAGHRMADVERLIEDLRTTHPSTDLVIDDGLRQAWVPPDLAETVHRLVQEAATNIRRHGDPLGDARFTLVQVGPTIELTVENRMAHAVADTGYGLIGMRERVEALGGRFDAGGDEQNTWIVRAELPLELAARSSNGAL